jgi:hypothetical protein
VPRAFFHRFDDFSSLEMPFIIDLMISDGGGGKTNRAHLLRARSQFANWIGFDATWRCETPWLVMTLLDDDVLEEIRYRVVQGFDNREAVFRWILANYPEPLGIAKAEYGAEDLKPETGELLRDAIERAFAEKAKEMESWPPQTDCDRLRAAFDALDKQGIVALESPGLTQDDGIPYAASLAVVRDELGGNETHGYCFFTWNDMARAIDGEGLSLAYGTFKEEPNQSSPSALTLGQKVGAVVLETCREAGLGAEWTESLVDYVELPNFRWQRRFVLAKGSDVRDFLDSWELEIRAGYTPADRLLETLEERAFDWFEDFSDFGPNLFARLRTHTMRFLEEERAREAGWIGATINDRIAAAFDELNERDVLARECSGLTIQDGWGYAGVEAEPHHRGVVFFHHEDVIDGVGGGGLRLAFGAIDAKGTKDDAASLALAHEVLAVLERHGIPSSWSRSVSERIRIAPFEWRRRRWTKAPSYERREFVAEVSTRPSRIFRAGAGTGRTEVNPNTSTPSGGIVVRALRDEGGFDMRRSMRLRAAWKAAGNSGEAQAGHVGLPHVFVRAGEFTTMAPRPSDANLFHGRHECFLRGARASKSGAM